MNVARILTAIAAATEPIVEETAPQLTFQPGNFISNLGNMGIGMLVIFVVIGIIVLTTMLINWLFSEK